jgi:hypothetical protein
MLFQFCSPAVGTGPGDVIHADKQEKEIWESENKILKENIRRHLDEKKCVLSSRKYGKLPAFMHDNSN